MATRERTCPVHGYFTKIVPLSAPTKIVCPECGGETYWTPTKAAQFGFKGKEAIPNSTSDMSEYSDWQRDQLRVRNERMNNASSVEDYAIEKIVDKEILEQAQAI